MSPNSDAESYLKPFGGKNKNCLNEILEDNNDEGMNISSDSPYVTLEQLCEQAAIYRDRISILSLNSQSISSKFQNISLIIENLRLESNFSFSVICIQESWLSQNSVDATTFSIPNYKKPFDLPASCSKHGGLICYVHDSLEAEIVKRYNTSKLYEGLVIEISGRGIQPTLVANFYRPPKFNNNNLTIEEFTKEFSAVIIDLDKSNQNVLIAGDLNIDLLKVNEKEKYANFLDLMLEYGFFPKITMPTRFARKSASLIDQIYIKNKHQTLTVAQSGILLSPTSDHFGCFSILHQNLKKINKPKYIEITNVNDTTINNFSKAIGDIHFWYY